jgi:formamidopyrimidine-DNA glycosylase
MPELPEVQTTVNGLNTVARNHSIRAIWTDYKSAFHEGKDNIKNPAYFPYFKKEVTGRTILGATRIGKNILISLSGGRTVLIHMKMTGHLLYGHYLFQKGTWKPADPSSPLGDPYNRFIHLVFSLSNGKHLAFSDARKFAKILVVKTDQLAKHADLGAIGPDPLSPRFTLTTLRERLALRPHARIKQALMDQHLIAGIGNIYSDEILWRAGIHPESIVSHISAAALAAIFKAMKPLLEEGIDFGGDSTSDYRNIYGERGAFQGRHHAYRRTGDACDRKGCTGTIARRIVGGRSAHFCTKHQIKV